MPGSCPAEAILSTRGHAGNRGRSGRDDDARGQRIRALPRSDLEKPVGARIAGDEQRMINQQGGERRHPGSQGLDLDGRTGRRGLEDGACGGDGEDVVRPDQERASNGAITGQHPALMPSKQIQSPEARSDGRSGVDGGSGDRRGRALFVARFDTRGERNRPEAVPGGSA